MYSWDNAQVVLAGNKCDLDQDRAVTQERGKRLADQLGNFLLNVVSWMYACLVLGLFFYMLYLFMFIYVVLCVMFFQRVLQIKTHSWDKTPVILIGNKCDMANERVVLSDEGKKLAEELGKFFSFIYLINQ